ncbi:MAG: amidohydrolase [Firmicutes bacterium]|nr:amidohydrolase [Bacillota bacterium]
MKAIINAKVKTMTGKDYDDGVILIEKGKIAKVGPAKSVKVPKGAEVIDAKKKLVTPGLIDAHSHMGMWEESNGFEGSDGNEITDPVTPNMRAIDAIYPFDTQFESARNGGVTAVVTGPGSANVIGGTFVAIKTVGKCVDDMLIKDPVAMKCAFGENPKRCYGSSSKMPMTRMATAALLRQTIEQAIEYNAKKKAAKKDPAKMPAYNAKLEAMIPVIEKKIPLKAHAHRTDDILTSIRIAKEYGLKMTLDHCTEGHLIVDEVKRSGFNAIIGPTYGFRTKYELRNKTFDTPGILSKAGIKIAIMTDSPVHHQSELPLFAAMAVNSGMDREEALKAITINAAEITGIDKRVGSIAPGKDADIVIWDTDPLSLEHRTYMVLIDGEVVHKL